MVLHSFWFAWEEESQGEKEVRRAAMVLLEN